MKRTLLAFSVIALAAATFPQATRHAAPGANATPSRITVITKNSDYPRLNRDGLTTQNYLARGQWI